MITYSRQEVEKQLVADQSLWRKLPSSATALLWPLEIVLLDWGSGWWAGLLTVAALGAISVALPPRLGVSVYLVDLLDRFLQLPLVVGWLLLAWHLWLREPIFPILGQPLAGAIAVTAALWFLTRLLAPLSRLGTRMVMRGR